MALPAGFELPPLPHLVALLVAVAGVGRALWRERPAVSPRLVLALSPWMVAGASLYVVYQLGLFPASVAPLFASPVVYATTAVVAGVVWLAALRLDADPSLALAAAGTLAILPPAGAALAHGLGAGRFAPLVPAGGVVAALLATAALWAGLRLVLPAVAATTGGLGVLAIFGHALDGFSTALGIATLGFGEQMPVSDLLIGFGGDLFVLPFLGGAWLFVLVKLALGTAVVWLFADYVREAPRQGSLLLGFVAAVGLGPGAHNVLLFAVTAPGF